MKYRHFPITVDPACPAKWNWSTLYLSSGRTASCHRAGWSDLTVENFDDFHNTEKKIKERQRMLAGQWPEEHDNTNTENSCNYCKNVEAAGGYSDRLQFKTIPDLVPAELDSDLTAVRVSPTILEVFFKNTCNMSCLYCLPELSSQINQENIKFGNFSSGGVELSSVAINSDLDPLIEKFWQWMEKNSKTLKRFHILGGEPFYIDQYYQCLDYFENNAHPDLEFNLISNLMVSEKKIIETVGRWKNLLAQRKLKRIDITCSIDCWGPQQEYVRHGLDLDVWERNFKILLDQPWLTININQTISLLTIKTMPDLLSRLAEWRKQRNVGHVFSAVAPQPSYLMINNLGNNIFKNDFDSILSLMPQDTLVNKTAHQYMTGLANYVQNSTVDPAEIKKLFVFLNEKDRRRNTNWRSLFPWLEEFEQYVV